MPFYLVRHGRAVPGRSVPDAGRWLTRDGRDAVVAVGAKLREMGVVFDAVVTSPLVRAVQTAELMTAAQGYRGEIEALLELIPEGRPTIAVDTLPTRGSSVAAFSHEPTISAVASLLTQVRYHGFTPGEVVCVGDDGTLEWSLDPDTLKRRSF